VVEESDYPERMVVSPGTDTITADPELDGPDVMLCP
jgi:hypothetical protein